MDLTDFTFYLDLDGVCADYDAGIRSYGFDIDPAYKNDLNKSGTKNPLKRQMYEAIKGKDFYYHLPFMPGAVALYSMIEPAKPIILTAAPKFDGDESNYYVNPHWLGAAYHKRRWVEERLLPAVYGTGELGGIPVGQWADFDTDRSVRRVSIPDEQFVCTTSARKKEFMHRRKTPRQVLIDDRIDNCRWWAEAGGEAVFHSSAETSARLLNLLVKVPTPVPGVYGVQFLPPISEPALLAPSPILELAEAVRRGELPARDDGFVDFSGIH